MEKTFEDQVMLNEILQHQEYILQDDLVSYGFKNSSLVFTNDEVLEEEQLILEDNTC